MKFQFVRVLSRGTIVCAIAAILPTAAHAAPFARPAAPAARTAAAGITYAANTVVVPRSVVSSQLVSIEPGGVYRFRHAAGPLAQL